jgi:hypothetical protein
MQIKYQGGVTKLIASKIAKKNKAQFADFVKQNLKDVRSKLRYTPIKINVVSLSSSADFYDQILSILSFLRYVGTPQCWTIYSDGSHTKQQIELIKSGLEFVEIKNIDLENDENLVQTMKPALLPYKEYLLDYARRQPMGKKLFYYLNHAVTIPTLFLDSDILFYNKADIFNVLLKEDRKGWFLPDATWGCLDSRYLSFTTKQLYQVNAGFFLLHEELGDVSPGLLFLKNCEYKYEYFSEQTIFHIIFNKLGFFPLDPRVFILNTLDQFTFSYASNRESIAMRHYTGPVRHKMWQRDWRWHLSLT